MDVSSWLFKGIEVIVVGFLDGVWDVMKVDRLRGSFFLLLGMLGMMKWMLLYIIFFVVFYLVVRLYV